MRTKITFFTGARSEYGIIKNLIEDIEDSDFLEYGLIVSGMHLLDKFGYTINEIIADNLKIDDRIPVFLENKAPNDKEFSALIGSVKDSLIKHKSDFLFIVGDRIEAYAAALGAHFANVPIIHSGGGTITKGAVDNIYRYNITNLSSFHFTTSLKNTDRLKYLPVVEKKNVFFTGSIAIDSIKKFLKNPITLKDLIPNYQLKNFCLMTFHPVTSKQEPIVDVMRTSLQKIVELGYDILITYPNSDVGYEGILNVIKEWENHPKVLVIENLGRLRYYAAMNESQFIIGNSSSGIIEGPYFKKRVINIGSRQLGREMDENVIDLPCDCSTVASVIETQHKAGWYGLANKEIYGSGNSVQLMKTYLEEKIVKNKRIRWN